MKEEERKKELKNFIEKLESAKTIDEHVDVKIEIMKTAKEAVENNQNKRYSDLRRLMKTHSALHRSHQFLSGDERRKSNYQLRDTELADSIQDGLTLMVVGYGSEVEFRYRRK